MPGTARRGRYQGKRVAARPAPAGSRPRSGGKKKGELTPLQRRRTIQLVVAGSIFVALVVWKLLAPQSLSAIAGGLREALSQDADFQAAFSAVGEAIAGEKDVGDSLQEAYTAVFAPARYHAAQASAAFQIAQRIPDTANLLYQEMTRYQQQEESPPEGAEEPERQVADSQALVFFSAAAPANVSFEQEVMGFPYTTPAQGTMTDTFGYRDHPIYHEERFHYGLDIANVQGTAISAFADGTVKATGESSSLGIYVMLSHPNNITTIYAHCSRVLVSSGQKVSMGEKIAEMGATGLATGSHLHLEILDGDTYLNPIYYVEVH